MRRHWFFVALATLGLIWQGTVDAGPFTPGNLAIYRVGDGSGSLTNAATPVFIDEYTTSGTLVQSIAMPTSVSGSNRRLTASGTATSEGQMTRSVDGRYLVLTGYDANVGTAGIASTPSTDVNRVVGRVDWDGNIDTTTALPDAYDTNNIRGAASTNGTDIWLSGTGSGTSNGVRYTTLGSTSSIRLSTTVTNIRTVNIFGGQLFASMQSNPYRLGTVGSGTPTGPADSHSFINLPGYPSPSSGGAQSNYAFIMFDLDSSTDFNGTGLDTLYVTVDSSNNLPGGDKPAGVFKWSFDGTEWVFRGVAQLSGVRGITGLVNSDNSVTLYVTTDTTLQTLTDTAAWNDNISGSFTTLASAAPNTRFRGIAFAPVPEPGALALGGAVVLLGGSAWLVRRRRTLGQSQA